MRYVQSKYSFPSFPFSFGISAAHLISASVMSAPAALACAKILYPELEQSKTNKNINLTNKELLKKRFCIEPDFGFLENSINMKHTRHSSSINSST